MKTVEPLNVLQVATWKKPAGFVPRCVQCLGAKLVKLGMLCAGDSVATQATKLPRPPIKVDCPISPLRPSGGLLPREGEVPGDGARCVHGLASRLWRTPGGCRGIATGGISPVHRRFTTARCLSVHLGTFKNDDPRPRLLRLIGQCVVHRCKLCSRQGGRSKLRSHTLERNLKPPLGIWVCRNLRTTKMHAISCRHPFQPATHCPQEQQSREEKLAGLLMTTQHRVPQKLPTNAQP